MAPAATRAAVSRALARSRMSRMSSRPYFATPARSACPGRGFVTGARRAPVASGAGSGPVNMVCCQFTQSRFSMIIAIGPPILSPPRTPDTMSALSDSIAIRRPRPYPPCRRRRSRVTLSRSMRSPAGIPSRMTTRARPCDSPAVRNRTIRRLIVYEDSATFRSARRENPGKTRRTQSCNCAEARQRRSA